MSPLGARRFSLPRGVLPALLAGLTALAGWLALRAAQTQDSSGSRLWGTVYMVVGINSDEQLDSGLRQLAAEAMNRFSKDFRELHPGVDIQLMTFPEDQLVRQLGFRQQGGLGPDLLLVNSRTAVELQRLNLVRSVTFPAELLQQIEPDMLARLRLGDGTLAGLPVLQLPQLACFNRERLPTGSPDSLDGLLQLSSRGLRVGLSAIPQHLFWTAGGMGATEAVLAALGDEPLRPDQKQSLERWLAWLQNASLQQSFTFYDKQDELALLLANGNLDWISCRSSTITLLRQKLGAKLGVASLPGGRWGAATPINRERVLVFGLNSSPAQRQVALEMAKFSVNPVVQRNLTLSTLVMLPVNRFAPAPVASSATLAAMARSVEESDGANPLIQVLIGDRKAEQALSSVLNRVLYGDLTPRQGVGILPESLRKARHGSPP